MAVGALADTSLLEDAVEERRQRIDDEREAAERAQAEHAELERDLRLVDAAIALVQRGAAIRVTVANLRLGPAVEQAARARAGLRGLRVAVDAGAQPDGAALVIEREPDGPNG